MTEHDEIRIPGLGETQRRLLLALKRHGPATTGELAEGFELATGTLREHLKSLEARRLIERAGSRRHGPGRPHVVYALTDSGEALFPSRESELLVDLVGFLLGSDRPEMIDEFFERRVEETYAVDGPRLDGMSLDEREEEALRILGEAGFMPELEVDPETGETILRLCNCPLKSVISVTRRPCVAEEKYVSRLVDGRLERFEYMPDGDDSCSYRVLRDSEG